MFKFARKALYAAATCTACASIVLGGAMPAWGSEAKTLALPVEFNDFNADNVIFEYQLDGGLENLGTGSGTGLVESTLGEDGNPVYTRAAVEGAAYNMAKQLNGDWQATAPEGGTAALYAALQGELRSQIAQDITVMDNDNLVSFGENGWKATTSDHTAVGEDLYHGAGPAWKQDNNAVLGYDHDTPLVRTYQASDLLGDGATTFAGHNVMFKDGWNNADFNKAGYTVTFSSGTWTSDPFVINGDTAKPWTEVWVPSKDDGKGVGGAELTITITPNECASLTNPCRVTAVSVAANKLHVINLDSGAIIYGTVYDDQMGLDAEGNRFYDNGWTCGDSFDYENGSAVSGTIAWSRSGNGVIGYDTTSTITRTFDVTEDTAYSPYLWSEKPDASVQASGMLLQFYAGETAEGEPLATFDTSDYAGGWFATGPVVSVPAGVTKLTVALTPKAAGVRVAAVELNALGSTSKIGNYDETVAKYADGSKTLDDATTCMDYVYCVLNHLYDGSSLSYKGNTLKTPVSGLYNSITLKQDDAEDGYTFVADTLHSAQKSSILEPGADEPDDGFKDLKYDLAAGTIENVDAGTGDDRAGFFPLDGLAGGQSFSAMYEYDNGDPDTQASKVAAMGSHNYHYNMVSRSKFTYDASKNQYFTFEGDDDTYLFINNQLVIDLGGAHLAQEKTVALEEPVSEGADQTWAQYLGLEDGKTYNFDFFYMERHTDNSDFMVSTNIDLKSRADNGDDDDPTKPGDNGGDNGNGSENGGNAGTGNNGGKPSQASNKKKDGKLPQTGDNVAGFVAIAAAGLVAAGAGLVARKRS